MGPRRPGFWWFDPGITIGFATLIAACGNDYSASLSGTVRSGPNPISAAAVTLYQAGNAGARTGATALDRATTDCAGNFTMAFVPPTGRATLYLVALGGDAGLGNNPAIGLIGVAGLSNALPASVTLNELTTVAAQWALAQFTDSTGQQMGTTSTNAPGIQNAVELVEANLVDSAGNPAGFWPAPAQCAGTAQPANCEGLKLMNALANMLAACIDSPGPASAACAALFSATGAGGTTLAAAHAIAAQPAHNAGELFVLSQSAETYAPGPGRAPDAWTIALKYVGNGAEFDGPGNMAVDRFGNIWITNNYEFDSDPRQSVCGGKQLLELTPTGADAPGAPFSGGGIDGAGFGIAIDLKNDLWVGNFGFAGKGCSSLPAGNSAAEFSAAGATLSPAIQGFTQGSLSGPQGMAVDQSGNLWIANYDGNSITEYLGASPASALNFTGLGLSSPFGAAADAAGRLWFTSSGNDLLVKLGADGKLAGSFSNGGLKRPLGLAIDSLGNVWVANNGGDSVTMLDSSGAPRPGSPFSGGGIRLPWGVAVDGDDNVWVANFTGSGGRLSELCGATVSSCPAGLASGAPISPTTGYTSGLLMRNTGVAIDPSGNVWVANNWRPVPLQTNPGGDSLVEFVGLAAPVKTPALGPPQKP